MTNLSPAKRKKALNFSGILRHKRMDDKLWIHYNEKQIKILLEILLIWTTLISCLNKSPKIFNIKYFGGQYNLQFITLVPKVL